MIVKNIIPYKDDIPVLIEINLGISLAFRFISLIVRNSTNKREAAPTLYSRAY